MFPNIAYLDWIEGRPEAAAYDLGSSDLRRAPAGPGEVVPPALAVDATNADDATSATDAAKATSATEDDVTDAADDATSEATAKAQLADVYGVAPENVLLTAGATHANFLAIATTLSEAESKGGPAEVGSVAESEADGEISTGANDSGGGESGTDGVSSTRVLVEKPGYEPLVATPRGFGAIVDRFRRPKADGYPLDPDRVSGALVADTAMVTVTNRHNPSGRRVGRDVLTETAHVVADGSARLLVDEVYAPFAGEAESTSSSAATGSKDGSDASDSVTPFGGPTAAGLPNTVVTNSLTKFFGFGDVRLGWLVADEAFVDRARSVRHHVPAVADPSRRLARRALARADELAADSRERIRANHEALTGFAAEREDLSGRVEPGCTYAFLEHESADGDEVTAAAWEQDVLVVPGRFFDDADRFRIAACQKPETVRASLDRLGDVLDGLGG